MKKRGTMSPMKAKFDMTVTVTASETPTTILASPTSLTMKNSFILINSDESFDNYKIAKQNKRGFFEKLEDEKAGEASQFGFVTGSKPTPRDGHSATVDSQGNMYVFGGDRHHMPFNDLYMLKLDWAREMQEWNNFKTNNFNSNNVTHYFFTTLPSIPHLIN